MSFLLGMLTMYIITGILFILDETFGNGFLDGWFFYLFTWWLVILLLPFTIIIKKIKNYKILKKAKERKNA